MLHCQVDGIQPITTSWRRNGVLLLDGENNAMFVNGSLVITRFQKTKAEGSSDEGDYDCVAQNHFGLVVSRKAKVQAATMADFHVHPQSVQVEEGGVSRFQCHIHGLPEPLVSWEKNGVPVDTDNERYTLLPTGVLQITGVRAEDSGIFRCVATNIASVKRSLEARLTVSGFQSAVYKEPMILVGPENLTLTVHQTAILECVATGYPRPIVSWSRLVFRVTERRLGGGGGGGRVTRQSGSGMCHVIRFCITQRVTRQSGSGMCHVIRFCITQRVTRQSGSGMCHVIRFCITQRVTRQSGSGMCHVIRFCITQRVTRQSGSGMCHVIRFCITQRVTRQSGSGMCHVIRFCITQRVTRQSGSGMCHVIRFCITQRVTRQSGSGMCHVIRFCITQRVTRQSGSGMCHVIRFCITQRVTRQSGSGMCHVIRFCITQRVTRQSGSGMCHVIRFCITQRVTRQSGSGMSHDPFLHHPASHAAVRLWDVSRDPFLHHPASHTAVRLWDVSRDPFLHHPVSHAAVWLWDVSRDPFLHHPASHAAVRLWDVSHDPFLHHPASHAAVRLWDVSLDPFLHHPASHTEVQLWDVSPPAEFVQSPQSISRPLGTTAIFTCVAQGEPAPQLTWLKNGQILETSNNVKLRNNNSSREALGSLAPLNITQLDPSVVYEVKLLAFNQHGEGNSSVRFVSLRDTVERSVLNTPCNCVKDEQNKTSTTGIIIGIHIGVTCIIFCVLFLMFGYRGRLLMCKNVQDHLATPQVVRNQTGSSAGLVLNRVSRRDLDETGNTGKQPADTNELERLFPGTPLREQPDKGNETDNIPSTLHDETQISTLPLDEFSIMEERQPPSGSAPVGGATGPSENHLHRAEEQG
ncbi:UNVERIFIED_CONTAM: hypothetical protein FKN15_057152 [Acipenser sinensis]